MFSGTFQDLFETTNSIGAFRLYHYFNGSPSSEGSNYKKAFSLHGNFQNYVRDMGSYERMRERARHTRRNLWQSRSG